MTFRYYDPCAALRPHIRHYYLFESEGKTAFEDVVFPSGDIELIFNLGDGIWEANRQRNPKVELWGQVTRPMAIRSEGSHVMLGVKFFPHAAAAFLHQPVGGFNDQVIDATQTTKGLHEQLQNTQGTKERIQVLEGYLLKRLRTNANTARVAHILRNVTLRERIDAIAGQMGITPRYLHKLVYEETGLSPTVFHKIKRFQGSLKLIARNDRPLTSIAYDCGYFDQSHFIREFKSFTGLTPSAYARQITPVNLLMGSDPYYSATERRDSFV